MKSLKTAVIVALVAASIGAGAWLARSHHSATPIELQSGTLLDAPRTIAPFSMLDQDGKPFGNAQFMGHWSVLFAGFTHCPDVCPTTLAVLKQVAERLHAQAPAMLFLTVDPERDTPAVLKPYVRFFGANVTGLSGSADQLQRLAESIGVAYIKVPGAKPDEYTMDHSAALVLIDPQGRVAGYFTPPHKADTLAADLTRVTAS